MRTVSSGLNCYKVYLEPLGLRQLNMRGFDNIETLPGGEDQWQNLDEDLAEPLNAAETGCVRNAVVS